MIKRESRFNRGLYYILLGIIIVLLGWIAFELFFTPKEGNLVSKNGILDLFEWKRNAYSSMLLSGECEFYWKKIITEEDLMEGEKPDCIAKIPSIWNNYRLGKEKLSGFGYATFVLHAINAEKGKEIAVRMPPMSTSYRLYIDDQLMAQNGIVGTSKEASEPEYQVEVFRFMPQSDSFDIILQISNYTYARGGVKYAPLLGTLEALKKIDQELLYRDVFLLGCFLIMLLQSLFIYLLNRKEKSYLYFALMCVMIIARITDFSSYLITRIPLLSNLEIMVRIDYLSLTWISLGFLFLSYYQFPDIIDHKVKKTVGIYTGIFSIIVLLTPISFFTHLAYLMEAVCVLMACYTMTRIYKAYITGYHYAVLIILASILFFLCSVHDLLLQNSIVLGNAVEYFPIGFFVFLICEDFVLAIKYSKALKECEAALEQLEEVSRKEHVMEMKFLRSQIKPHFIHNALNAIIAISRTDSDRSRDLLVEFSQYLRSCFDFENLENLIPMEREIIFIRSYLAIEKARFGGRLMVEYDIDNMDIMIPPLILQPLVENAVQHGISKKPGGGKLTVFVKQEDDTVWIGVKDDGVGISPDRVKTLLEGKNINQGVGLYNINQRLNKLYHTSLSMECNGEGGSIVSMKLPVYKGRMHYDQEKDACDCN